MGHAGWFMVFPICNAMVMYATVPILNIIAGPIFVASFAIARTLARTIQQAIGVFSAATWPEITVQYIKKNTVALRTLFIVGGQFAIVASVSAGFAIFAISPWLFRIWLQGRHAPPMLLVALLLIESSLAASKSFSDTILMATNHHIAYAKVYLAAHVASLVASVVFGHVFGWIGFESPLIFLMMTLLIASNVLAGQVVGLTIADAGALLDVRPIRAYAARFWTRLR